jgi:hypothetical protein
MYIVLNDLNELPHPINGKILIPFTQLHEKEEYI